MLSEVRTHIEAHVAEWSKAADSRSAGSIPHEFKSRRVHSFLFNSNLLIMDNSAQVINTFAPCESFLAIYNVQSLSRLQPRKD